MRRAATWRGYTALCDFCEISEDQREQEREYSLLFPDIIIVSSGELPSRRQTSGLRTAGW